MAKQFTINVTCEGVSRPEALALIMEVVEQNLDGPLAELNPTAWVDLSAGIGFDSNPVQVRIPQPTPEIHETADENRITGQESVDRIVSNGGEDE